MSVAHYENFPVASLARSRDACGRPSSRSTAFARTADDFADEGDATPRRAPRRARPLSSGALDRGGGRRAGAGRPVSGASPPRSARHALPLAPVPRPAVGVPPGRHDDALSRRTPTLLDYCRRSANPVGRLLLHLYGAASPANFAHSDAICTALQLVNFWQDIAVDWRKGRVYLPQEDLARFGVTEARSRDARCDDALARAARASRPRAPARCSRPGARCARALPVAAGRSRSARRARRRAPHPRRASTRVRRRRVPPPAAARRRATGRVVAAQALVPPRRHRAASPEGRAMTPDEYCQQKAARQRLELLLQLPVPAARAAPRDHRALRVLPRSRRRRRRGRATRTSRAPSSRGGGRRSSRPSPARRSTRWRCALQPVSRRLSAAAGALPGGDRRHGDGPRAQPLPRLRRRSSVYCHRVAGRRGPDVGRHLRLHGRATPRLRARPRHRVPAHQHHPRRRRGRAARPHLPAAGRARALRRHAVGAPARARAATASAR